MSFNHISFHGNCCNKRLSTHISSYCIYFIHFGRRILNRKHMILFRKRTFFNVERQIHRNETILIKRSTDENRWRIRAREEESRMYSTCMGSIGKCRYKRQQGQNTEANRTNFPKILKGPIQIRGGHRDLRTLGPSVRLNVDVSRNCEFDEILV